MEWIIGGIIGFFIGGMFCWFVQEFRTKSTLDRESAKHNVEVAGLQARLEIADNAQRIIESAKTQMGETFRAAAADALSGNTAQFLSLANENFNRTLESAKGEFHQRHQQFQEMVKPLAENYSTLNPQIDSLMKHDAGRQCGNQEIVRRADRHSSRRELGRDSIATGG